MSQPNVTPRILHCCLAVALSGSAVAAAQSPVTADEARTSRALDAARKEGAPELYAFLKSFPKGADLHMHLSGAIYAETFIAEAASQKLCVLPADPGTPPVPTPQGTLRLGPVTGDTFSPCGTFGQPAAKALVNQALYDAMVDSFSMRGFVPSPGITGHDQFFATFGRFGGLKNFAGDWLQEVTTRAATQNEQYLEIMQTPSYDSTYAASQKIGWPVRIDDTNYKTELPKIRDQLFAAGLRDDVPKDAKELADAKAAKADLEHCSVAADFIDLEEQGGCGVRIHWIYQVLRGYAPQSVFAQTLLGFELATADPDVVGLNFVMPEDGRLSMQDYHLQMLMLDYLHGVYPTVHISLHAGELAPGMVPPDGLTFHIREAVELGHADRIGHGVDILYEDNPAELLKEMAARHTDVEVNLTSNDVILGIKGTDHPLTVYRAAHVPFSLSTDDEGVSRIDLTHEYVRAVLEQGLTYSDLKLSARDSLEYSFLHGESLFARPGDFTHRVAACAEPVARKVLPPGPCAAFLATNEKAAEQYELERRFAAFEEAR